MWSQRVQYALRALVALAAWRGKRIASREIAQRHGIPQKYLETILLDLRQAGLVKSTKGKSGGYELTREPSTLTLLTIVQALEPEWFQDAAPAGVDEVTAEAPVLSSVSLCVRRELEAMTLADALMQWQQAKNSIDYAI